MSIGDKVLALRHWTSKIARLRASKTTRPKGEHFAIHASIEVANGLPLR